MTFNQTPQSKVADLELNDSLSDFGSDEVRGEVTPDMELERILDYQAQSLAKPDHLEACLGSSNASLMKIGCHLAELINQGMVGLDMAKLTQLQPAIDTYLRTMRQARSYAQLEVSCAESRQKAEEKKSQPQPKAPRGFAPSKNSPTPWRC
jgi:hypothetical protein